MGNFCCTGDKKQEYETNLTSKGPFNNVNNDFFLFLCQEFYINIFICSELGIKMYYINDEFDPPREINSYALSYVKMLLKNTYLFYYYFLFFYELILSNNNFIDFNFTFYKTQSYQLFNSDFMSLFNFGFLN